MRIDPAPSLAKLTLSAATAGAQTRQWSVGQLLQASVTGRAANGEYSLRIGQQEVRAQSPVPLQIGERMALKVLEAGQLPVLQRISPDAALKETMSQALRDYLPRQSSVSPLLANLSHLSTNADARAQLPPSALKLAQSIFQQLPRAEQLSSPGILKQQVENAALFLESRLAARVLQPGAGVPQENFKASLLRLAALLPLPQGEEKSQQNPATARQLQPGVSSALFKQPLLPPTTTQPPQTSPLQPRPETEAIAKPTLALQNFAEEAGRELAKQVESVLSRVVVNQLSSLNAEQNGQQQWLVDIPMRENNNGKLLQLHIEKDEKQSSEQTTETHWSFSLSIDLGELGPLHARVSLHGDRLTANLWAEQEQTLDLINQHSDYLGGRLVEVGLENNQVRCFMGKPDLPLNDAPQESLISQHV